MLSSSFTHYNFVNNFEIRFCVVIIVIPVPVEELHASSSASGPTAETQCALLEEKTGRYRSTLEGCCGKPRKKRGRYTRHAIHSISPDRHLEHQKFSKNANPTLRTCLETTAGDQDAVLSLDLEHQIKKQENSQKTVT